MPNMIHSKYGYEPPEYVKADAELDKWLKKKKESLAVTSLDTSYTGDVHSHAGRAHFYRSAEWKALRKQVLERDHYECQWCKAEGRVTTGNDMTLEIDHIKTLEERPDLALDPDNLRTLCRDCHNKRHGRFNYKRLGRPKNPYANDERW